METEVKDNTQSLKLVKSKLDTFQKVGTLEQDEAKNNKMSQLESDLSHQITTIETKIEQNRIDHLNDINQIYETIDLLKNPLSDVLQDFVKEKELMTRQMDRYDRLYRDLVSLNITQHYTIYIGS